MKRLLGTAAAAGLTLLLGIPAAHADGETGELSQTSAYVGPSLTYILSTYEGYIYHPGLGEYLNGGQPFNFAGRCTGYVVNPDGYIATAGHCVDNLGRGGSLIESLTYQGAQWAVENDSRFYALYSTPEEVLANETFEVHGYADGDVDPDLVSVEVSFPADATGQEIGETAVAEVVDWHPLTEDDTALLKVNLENLIPLPLSDGEDVVQGTEVVNIGFPGSVDEVTTPTLNASYKEGAVSSIKTNQAGTGDVYEVSSAVSGGMSGGPVVNLDNEVIGFNSYGNATETEAFNFSGPSEAILTLMQQNGVENELGPVGEQYRAGLDALFAGDRAEAIAAFEAVLDEDSDNAWAQMYLEQAEDLEASSSASESGSDSGGFPILWVAIGAGGLVVVGLLLFLVLRKGGSSSTSTGPSAPAVPGVAAWPPAPAQQQPYAAPVQQQPAYPPAPAPAPAPTAAPQMPVPPAAAPKAAPAFDPNKTTFVGQAEAPYIPQQQQPGQQPGQQPPR